MLKYLKKEKKKSFFIVDLDLFSKIYFYLPTVFHFKT